MYDRRQCSHVSAYCDTQDPLDISELLDMEVSFEVVDGSFNQVKVWSWDQKVVNVDGDYNLCPLLVCFSEAAGVGQNLLKTKGFQCLAQ